VTTVQLLASVQGHQVARVRTIAAKLREREPAVTVELVEGPATAEQLQRHKLQFGPAVVIDGRLEFVGIPRLSMLLNRVAVARKRAEANLPSTEPFKVDVAGKDSKVVTLLRHPAAATAPAGFQADVYETLAGNRTGLVNVTLYADPSQAAAMGIAQGAVGGALTGLNFALSNTRPVTGMDFEPVAGAGLTAIDFFLPGILGMTILTTPFFGMANTCAEYRARGYFKFLATTTLRKGEWLLSKALWYSALLILAMFVMIAFGLVLFEMTLTLTPLALVIVVAGTMMFVSMGMLIGVFLRDVETATAVANAIGFPMMFLAGSFFPLETMPGALRAVAAAMPLTYVNEGLRATMVYRNDATALVHLGVVLILTAVFFVVAARAMSWKGK